TCCGRISTPGILPPRWRSTRDENGALAPARAEPPERRVRRWGDLRLRILSAAVLAPLALLCVWLGEGAFLALLGLGTLGVTAEWVMMCRGSARAGAGVLALGLAYIAVAAVSLAWLRADPQIGRLNVLFLLILVWASDVGAYITGRAVGGAKLAPRISPGKTVSGALGGLAAAIFAGLVVAIVLSRPTSMWYAATCAGALGMVAQTGDLLESFVKRRFGVKD